MIQFGGFARDVVAGFGALHPEPTGLASRVFSFVDVMPQQIPGSTRTSRSHPSVFSAPHRTAPPHPIARACWSCRALFVRRLSGLLVVVGVSRWLAVRRGLVCVVCCSLQHASAPPTGGVSHFDSKLCQTPD